MNDKKQEMALLYEKEVRKIFDKTYDSIFYNGRKYERNKLIRDGWLCINPNKRKEIEEISQDPCTKCSNFTSAYSIGCKADSKRCEKKQAQLRALEILEYFK